ncbi:MAG: hypothetical protein V3R90_10795 [Limibaculum sp.]
MTVMIDRVENGFMDAAQENIAVHILGEDRNHGERSIRITNRLSAPLAITSLKRRKPDIRAGASVMRR